MKSFLLTKPPFLAKTFMKESVFLLSLGPRCSLSSHSVPTSGHTLHQQLRPGSCVCILSVCLIDSTFQPLLNQDAALASLAARQTACTTPAMRCVTPTTQTVFRRRSPPTSMTAQWHPKQTRRKQKGMKKAVGMNGKVH